MVGGGGGGGGDYSIPTQLMKTNQLQRNGKSNTKDTPTEQQFHVTTNISNELQMLVHTWGEPDNNIKIAHIMLNIA